MSGLWQVDKDHNGRWVIYGDGGWTIADVYYPPDCRGTGNAHLIAAAPELLEALKAAERAEGRLINEWADFWDAAPQSLIDALMEAQAMRNAAIAKAEGK